MYFSKKKLYSRTTLLTCLVLAWWILAGMISYKIVKTGLQQKNLADMEQYLSVQMKTCQAAGQVSLCLKKEAKDFLSRYPLRSILDTFKQNEKKTEFFSHCHELAHYLGQDEYARLKSVPAVFAESTEACLGGAYHGTIEGYFMDKHMLITGDPAYDQTIGTQAADICGQAKAYKIPQQFTECNHGLGHALMYATDNDLIRALKLCDYLKSTNEQELCYTGAFMQNADGAPGSDHPSKYTKVGDDLYPCYILDKKYQHICYTYAVLSRYQDDEKTAIGLCQKIPAEFAEECFKTYGRDRTMITADPKEIVKQCALIPDPKFSAECVSAAAYNLVIRFGLDSSLSVTLCQLQPNNLQADCFGQAIQASRTQAKDQTKLAKFCSNFPTPELQTQCLSPTK